MLTAVTVVLIGFALLAWSADRFVDGAAAIARHFRVSPMIIGLTIVSLCTSFPEMLVSAIAAWDGNSDLGVGNALGSNIANIGMVLGVTALVVPLTMHSSILKREMPVLLVVMVLALLLMVDGELGRFDGMLLLASLTALLWWLVHLGMQDRHDPLEEEFAEEIPELSLSSAVIWFIIGLVVLMVSSRMVVWGSVEIARFFGVSDLVIGLTIVAIGTSLPELMASIMSVKKGEDDLAIGNVVGSNMFNILAVLSMPALIAPQTFDRSALVRDFPIMVGFTLALFLMAYVTGKRGELGRIEGGILALSFFAYLYLLYLQG